MNRRISGDIDSGSLAEFLCPIRVVGDVRCRIRGAAALAEAGPEDLAFCNARGDRAYTAILSSQAGVVLCFDDVPQMDELAVTKLVVTVANPRLAFIRCLNRYFRTLLDWGIHPTAVIETDVVLPAKGKIGAHVYVGSGTEIGEGTILGHGAVIESGSRIGCNVFIQSGTVIGCDSVAFERNEEGALEKFPQYGWVVIEDDVEIGANCAIAKGTFTGTRIGRGSKIGNLVHIGHNVQVGRHVMMSAGITIVGSAQIGDFSWVGPGVVVRNGVHVGRNVMLGMGSVVTKDVEDNQTVMGTPARSRDKYVRQLKWIEKNAEMET
ncbi:MAG: DapH/DapD/GlmU-related protein [Candidatus Hodarchaeota archaeon]